MKGWVVALISVSLTPGIAAETEDYILDLDFWRAPGILTTSQQEAREENLRLNDRNNLKAEIKAAIMKLGLKAQWQEQPKERSFEYPGETMEGKFVAVRSPHTDRMFIVPDFSKEPDLRSQQISLLLILSEEQRLYTVFGWRDNRSVKLLLLNSFNETWLEDLEGRSVSFGVTGELVKIADLDIPLAYIIQRKLNFPLGLEYSL